jgi:hypothetical protein
MVQVGFEVMCGKFCDEALVVMMQMSPKSHLHQNITLLRLALLVHCPVDAFRNPAAVIQFHPLWIAHQYLSCAGRTGAGQVLVDTMSNSVSDFGQFIRIFLNSKVVAYGS